MQYINIKTGVGKRVARSPEAGRYSAGLVDSDSHIARRASDILERAYRIFNEHITESFVPPSRPRPPDRYRCRTSGAEFINSENHGTDW